MYKFLVLILIISLSFQGLITAQERDTLVERIANSEKFKVFQESHDQLMVPGAVAMPLLFQDFSGLDFGYPRVPKLNFQAQNRWKINWEPTFGIGTMGGFSGWKDSQGYYGSRTYKATDKLYIGTSTFSDRTILGNPSNRGIFSQTNYSSSMFVGYKFSDKFSISAGFTIQSYDDPLNRNHRMGNNSIFP
jgi:hypothetical protein